MKAITLTQPWAQLVALGAKRIETRSWSTKYRGPLAIHAAKGFPKDAQFLCFQRHFRDQLTNYVKLNESYFGDHKFPLGVVVATCELVDVVQIDTRYTATTTKFIVRHGLPWSLGAQERAFGDYSIYRYMWLLDQIEMLPEPIPARGLQRLWEWNGGV